MFWRSTRKLWRAICSLRRNGPDGICCPVKIRSPATAGSPLVSTAAVRSASNGRAAPRINGRNSGGRVAFVVLPVVRCPCVPVSNSMVGITARPYDAPSAVQVFHMSATSMVGDITVVGYFEKGPATREMELPCRQHRPDCAESPACASGSRDLFRATLAYDPVMPPMIRSTARTSHLNRSASPC
jgi:hypothetical protein